MVVSHVRAHHRWRGVRGVSWTLCIACAVASISANVRAQTSTSRDTAAAESADSTHHHGWWPSDFALALGPGVGWQRYTDRVSGRETGFTVVGGFYRGSKLGPESKAGFVVHHGRVVHSRATHTDVRGRLDT